MASIFWRQRANRDHYLVAQAKHPTQGRITKAFLSREEAVSWIASIGDNPPTFKSSPPRHSRPGRSVRPDVMQKRCMPANSGKAAKNCIPASMPEPQHFSAPEAITPHNPIVNYPHEPANSPARPTLAEVIDRYILEIMPQKRSIRSPSQQLKFWRDQLGHHPLHKITPAMIAQSKSLLLTQPSVGEKQRKTSTVNRYLAILCHVYTIAMKEWFMIDDNPALRVRKCKEPRGRNTFLSKENRALLLKAIIPEPELIQTVIKLALYSGMRYGEIMGLRWRQIDLERSRLVLEMTKNGHPRGVPLLGKALTALTAWSEKHQGKPDALLFPSTEDASKPFDIRRGWNRVRNQMGMPLLHFHDLRHCTVSYLAMSGATAQDFADVLGHETLSMVKRYSHYADDHSRAAMQRMIEKISKEDEECE